MKRFTCPSFRPMLLSATLTILLSLLVMGPASADPGLPMLAAVWPISWLLLPVIILIEGFIAVRILGERKAWQAATVANFFSTVLGIPVTWVLLVLLELATVGGGDYGLDTMQHKFFSAVLQSPWLVPYEGRDRGWVLPIAAASLCIPFFFMAVGVEYLVARRFFEKEKRALVRRWAWIAHAISYGSIILVLAAMALVHFPR